MGVALRNSGYSRQHVEDNPPESASISSGSLVESLSIYAWVYIRILLLLICMYICEFKGAEDHRAYHFKPIEYIVILKKLSTVGVLSVSP